MPSLNVTSARPAAGENLSMIGRGLVITILTGILLSPYSDLYMIIITSP